VDAYRCVATKRDLRTYTDQPLSDEVLSRILEAGRRSGSARNRQPWEFVAVTDRAQLRRLARCGRFAGHVATAAAAVVIVVEGTRDLFDAGRCAQSMMLAAWALGVASCPATLHDEAAARDVLGIPAGRVLAPAVAFGYPHPKGRGRIERVALKILAGRGRKPLAALVHRDRYGMRWGDLRTAPASNGAAPTPRSARRAR
jgi:nitroreductase